MVEPQQAVLLQAEALCDKLGFAHAREGDKHLKVELSNPVSYFELGNIGRFAYDNHQIAYVLPEIEKGSHLGYKEGVKKEIKCDSLYEVVV